MRILRLIVLMIASAGVVLTLAPGLAASEDPSPPPRQMRLVSGPHFVEGRATTAVWVDEGLSNSNPTFTESLLDSHPESLAAAATTRNGPKPPSKDNGPGAKVPEPATLLLAGAGLIGLRWFSGRNSAASD